MHQNSKNGSWVRSTARCYSSQKDAIGRWVNFVFADPCLAPKLIKWKFFRSRKPGRTQLTSSQRVIYPTVLDLGIYSRIQLALQKINTNRSKEETGVTACSVFFFSFRVVWARGSSSMNFKFWAAEESYSYCLYVMQFICMKVWIGKDGLHMGG